MRPTVSAPPTPSQPPSPHGLGPLKMPGGAELKRCEWCVKWTHDRARPDCWMQRWADARHPLVFDPHSWRGIPRSLPWEKNPSTALSLDTFWSSLQRNK